MSSPGEGRGPRGEGGRIPRLHGVGAFWAATGGLALLVALVTTELTIAVFGALALALGVGLFLAQSVRMRSAQETQQTLQGTAAGGPDPAPMAGPRRRHDPDDPDETPADETPADETPADETPAEETPADQSRGADDSDVPDGEPEDGGLGTTTADRPAGSVRARRARPGAGPTTSSLYTDDGTDGTDGSDTGDRERRGTAESTSDPLPEEGHGGTGRGGGG